MDKNRRIIIAAASITALVLIAVVAIATTRGPSEEELKYVGIVRMENGDILIGGNGTGIDPLTDDELLAAGETMCSALLDGTPTEERIELLSAALHLCPEAREAFTDLKSAREEAIAAAAAEKARVAAEEKTERLATPPPGATDSQVFLEVEQFTPTTPNQAFCKDAVLYSDEGYIEAATAIRNDARDGSQNDWVAVEWLAEKLKSLTVGPELGSTLDDELKQEAQFLTDMLREYRLYGELTFDNYWDNTSFEGFRTPLDILDNYQEPFDEILRACEPSLGMDLS